ncbi:hypothetical protein [Oceanirhabdus sp. W0125-5]|uniref:hypothetical protein n=1 Tax=Oceanirhabdus sp. W0125-5 TaxID=2999116 RepID=UPI0022F2D5C2|nr:hypothetical protein [Oceanirhabdus sp. W0125-5]WBW96891.1 hypothetical protein OW730_24855 [Oceanirhabdus sp. W0125-5]
MSWSSLDNAAKMYASLPSTRVTTLFRVSSTLNFPVNKDILQQALDLSLIRFPYFNVSLKTGLFWSYFDKSNEKLLVEEEKFYPCMNLNVKKHHFPFRVLYFNNRISLEFAHALTDGTGAIIFLQYLLQEYLKIKELIHENVLTYIGDTPTKSEFEDSYKKHFDRKIPTKRVKVNAFQFPFKLSEKGAYHIVTGILPVKDLLNKAKEFNCSLTELLCAIFIDSTIELIDRNGYKKKPIVLNIPINLRTKFPSKTMNNFFISLMPSIDPRLGNYTLKEIVEYIHNYMNLNNNEKNLKQLLCKNVRSGNNIFLRIIPSFIKDLIMPFVHSSFGEANYTSGFSNMGLVRLPSDMEKHIERFDVYPPPSRGNKIKVTAISYKDNLHITFGKMTYRKDFEEIFFSKIRKMNIPIKIETNYV